MTNHDSLPMTKEVGLFLAFARKKDGQATQKCIRVVVRDSDIDLAVLEAKLKILGGVWRIHATVNSRDTEKARKWLIHKLIDNPEFAGCVDSLWRTALLQPECKATNYFLLDIDTEDADILTYIESLVGEACIGVTKSPNGYHIITKPFDTREILKIKEVSLCRDGYVFIKKVGE